MSETIIRKLDTSKMDAAILAFSEGVEEYNSIRTTVKLSTTDLLLNWKGKGRKAFEKDYEAIFVQLKDIEDILYELYNALVDGLSTYIATDEQLNKQMTR
jgi:uncharacterized protein YukE